MAQKENGKNRETKTPAKRTLMEKRKAKAEKRNKK